MEANGQADRSVYGGHGQLMAELAADAVAERFSHLTLEVTDLDASEAWYRDVVGADLVGRGLTAEPREHSVLQMNTGQLIILVHNPGFKRATRAAVHHGFMVTYDQYLRALERLPRFGYSIGDTRQQFRARGEYSIDVQDPDGHRFQIQCYGPESSRAILPEVGVVDCGPADRYRVGDVKLFKAGNFFLVRLPEGFLAMTRWCCHMNGLVVYQREHWRFWCPYHSATYDLRGNATGGVPNLNALRLNPIRFSDAGHVLVDTDRVQERACFDPSQAVPPPASLANAPS
jgi:catechol 2,3-dioxygenase-like lactoylglutathione lyase family enzyme